MFYVVAVAVAVMVAVLVAVMGEGGGWSARLAWACVGLRVVHSIVQSPSNIISLRANLFMGSTVVLIALAVRAAVRAAVLLAHTH